MAAGGYKEFVAGETLDQDEINDYLMQGMLVFAGTAARGSAIGTPVEGQFSYLADTDAVEFYDGSAWTALSTAPETPVATGGTAYTDTVSGVNYKYHVFTASGDFVVSDPNDGLFNYILIAGGGSGGGGYSSLNAESGGGGGGGVIFGSAKLTAGTYPVVIGAGGSPAGYRGNDTTFNGDTAVGGGPGGDIKDGGTADGGSGGGGRGTLAGGAGVDGQGRAGGDGVSITEAGFGGGFGMSGSTSNAGDGVYLGTWIGAGNGYGLPGLSFADGWFAGGGGGRGDSDGGLGTDSVYGASATSTNASANTGGGGAGSYGSPGGNQTGSDGGSGIVFVYYEVKA